jgi:hypothetical protein
MTAIRPSLSRAPWIPMEDLDHTPLSQADSYELHPIKKHCLGHDDIRGPSL